MTPFDKSSPAFFENMYARDTDPWKFATDEGEQRRYATIIELLGAQPYRLCIEPACSVGALTERLAARCDFVRASDFSSTAANTARMRCSGLANVCVSRAAFPDEVDMTGADLLILSEIGYYFKLPQWRRVALQTVEQMTPGTTLLAAHWTGTSVDHCISGDQVHEGLREIPLLHHEMSAAFESFRVDRWVRR